VLRGINDENRMVLAVLVTHVAELMAVPMHLIFLQILII